MSAGEEYAAILAGLMGVLAISATKSSSSESVPTVSEGNGIWVPESDRDAVIKMINKAASKEYYIDANGFVKEVSGVAENLNKSSTYSSVLDRLIGGDNKVVIGVGDGWVSSGENGLEANAFTGNNSGITIGDNGTPQVVVVSGEDMPNSSADITLAHELIHALRGEEGIKSINTIGGINQDEEAHTIELENNIREELGYEVRKDGDSSDGGDGSYGKYSDSSEEDWYNKIDEMQGSETLSGNAYLNAYMIPAPGSNFSPAHPDAPHIIVYDNIDDLRDALSNEYDDDDCDCDCDCQWGANYDESIWSKGGRVSVVNNVVTGTLGWRSFTVPKRNWDTFFRSNEDTKKTLSGITTTVTNLGASILGLFSPILSAVGVTIMQSVKKIFSCGYSGQRGNYAGTYVVTDLQAYMNDKYGDGSFNSAEIKQLNDKEITGLLQQSFEDQAPNCSLTALTMISTYWRNHFGYDNIPSYSSDIYKIVHDNGVKNGYKPSGFLNGTMPYDIYNIAEGSFSDFGYCVTTDNKICPLFDDYKNEIEKGYPFLLNISPGSGIYSNHTILVTGYVTSPTGNFLITYNNWNKEPTYIDCNEFASWRSMTTVEYGEGWKSDSNGYCYREGNSWATGWKEIYGNRYYFDSAGYMVHDVEIDGHYLESNGAMKY